MGRSVISGFTGGFTVAIAASVFLMGCANQPHKVADVENSGKTEMELTDGRAVTASAAHEVQAHHFVEVEYKQGSAVLTDSSKKSLDQLVRNSARDGKIDEVLVMSWSDNEMPSNQKKKVSNADVALASRRNRAVADYLKGKESMDVDLYNMAERPTAFAKWFNTTDNRLKNALVAAGLPTTADDPQYPSKAGTTVVLVKLKE